MFESKFCNLKEFDINKGLENNLFYGLSVSFMSILKENKIKLLAINVGDYCASKGSITLAVKDSVTVVKFKELVVKPSNWNFKVLDDFIALQDYSIVYINPQSTYLLLDKYEELVNNLRNNKKYLSNKFKKFDSDCCKCPFLKAIIKKVKNFRQDVPAAGDFKLCFIKDSREVRGMQRPFEFNKEVFLVDKHDSTYKGDIKHIEILKLKNGDAYMFCVVENGDVFRAHIEKEKTEYYFSSDFSESRFKKLIVGG